MSIFGAKRVSDEYFCIRTLYPTVILFFFFWSKLRAKFGVVSLSCYRISNPNDPAHLPRTRVSTVIAHVTIGSRIIEPPPSNVLFSFVGKVWHMFVFLHWAWAEVVRFVVHTPRLNFCAECLGASAYCEAL